MWKALALLYSCVQNSYAVHGMQSRFLSGQDSLPALFAAVFSRRSDFERRGKIRQMWQDGASDWQASGWGKLEYKFVLGAAPEDENATTQQDLLKEGENFGDLLIEECLEGYLNGLLTAKLVASMRSYIEVEAPLDLFMKIDDDTFVDFSRLRGVLRKYISEGGNIAKAYMGVFPRNAETLEYHQGTPCRDPSSMWYEPETKFNGKYYPVAAQGGPGYILSKQLVTRIIEDGIATRNMLNTEDKAAGVWVDHLIKAGLDVEFVDIPGTNGYAVLDNWIKGPMFQYPFALHHHVDGETAACLHRAALSPNPLTVRVDQCNHGSTKDLSDGSVCEDGRKDKPHVTTTEGYSLTKWELDAYGDQVPIAGSTLALQ